MNYIRNSVKAVVNAYTGAVTLYQWGSSDPVLDAWMKAFPGVIKPQSAIPADLMPHLRYPPVLFEAQRQILAQYHVTQAPEFYGGQNFWAVPTDPSGTAPNALQPAALLPDDDDARAAAAGVLADHVAHPAGPGQHGRVHGGGQQPASPGYGTIRVLQLPQDTTIRGPQQVQNDFESNASVASALSLLRQRGSKVTEGNLITLPVGRRPDVLRARVRVPVGHRQLRGLPHAAGHARVLQRPDRVRADAAGALAKVFGTLVRAGTAGVSPPGTGSPAPANAAVLKYLQQAETYYSEAQAALRSGNLAAYRRATWPR